MFTVSSSARTKIKQFLAASKLPSPVVRITYSRRDDETSWRYDVGFDSLDDLTKKMPIEEMRQNGFVTYVDDLTFILDCPNQYLLDDMVLDWIENEFRFRL